MSMKALRSCVALVFRYSGTYYLLITILLFSCVDWTGVKKERLSYLMGMAMMRGFEDPVDSFLFADLNAELSPADPVAWKLLGVTYYNLGRYRQATKCFQKAAQLAPGSAEIAGLIGLAADAGKGARAQPLRITVGGGGR